MSTGKKGRKIPPPLSQKPLSSGSALDGPPTATLFSEPSSSASSATTVFYDLPETNSESLDEELAMLDKLRLDVDINLKLRPIALETPSPSQYYTPTIGYFSEAAHPLPISATSLFSRMLCSPRPILLDIRPQESFDAFRLKDSINVAIPRSMPGGHPQDLQQISDLESFVPSREGKRELEQKLGIEAWDGDIVVYDDDRILADNSPTWEVLDQLLPVVKGQVWYLEGGMSAASVLPRFELMVVTAVQTARETKPPPAPKLATPSKVRKRSAPNLRRLDTGSATQLAKHSPSIHSPAVPTPQLRSYASSNSLTIRPPTHPYLETPPSGSTADARTPRARSPMLTPRTALPEDDFTVSPILPNFLFLGPEVALPKHVAELQALGIKRILNVAIECDDNLGLDLKTNFIRYCRIPLKDHIEEENVGDFLRKSCDFLDSARLHDEPTYVHCKAGKSRSVMAVIGYLIHSHHWTLSKAYAFVLERREGISPNIGFVSELMSFEEEEIGGKFAAMPNSATAENGEGYLPQGLSGKRPANVRESLPPLLSSTGRSETEGYPTRSTGLEGKAIQETEVRDAWGRYRHQRRAPVDAVTLQPLRRVSKAGLESSLLF